MISDRALTEKTRISLTPKALLAIILGSLGVAGGVYALRAEALNTDRQLEIRVQKLEDVIIPALRRIERHMDREDRERLQ